MHLRTRDDIKSGVELAICLMQNSFIIQVLTLFKGFTTGVDIVDSHFIYKLLVIKFPKNLSLTKALMSEMIKPTFTPPVNAV